MEGILSALSLRKKDTDSVLWILQWDAGVIAEKLIETEMKLRERKKEGETARVKLLHCSVC